MNKINFFDIRKDNRTHTYLIIKSIFFIVLGIVDVAYLRPLCDAISIEWLSKTCVYLSVFMLIIACLGLRSALEDMRELYVIRREQAEPIPYEQIRQLFINEIIEICYKEFPVNIYILYDDHKMVIGSTFHIRKMTDTVHEKVFFIDRENNRKEEEIREEENFRKELERYATSDGLLNVISITIFHTPPEEFLQRKEEKYYSIYQRIHTESLQEKNSHLSN